MKIAPHALAGIKVVELGQLIAGPFAAKTLADFGADVIKIEPPATAAGEGGDPLFGGPKNKFMILGEWYKPYGGYDRHHAYLASYHKFYAHLESACTPELLAASGGTAPLCRFVAPYLDDPNIDSFLNRLMKINIRLKGGQNILVKVDKMLSCNSVRSASPLFDRRLAEHSMQIPPHAKRRGDIEKFAFKRAVEAKLPYAVVYRKKAGMGVPLNHWFRKTVLGEYAADLLRSERAKRWPWFELSGRYRSTNSTNYPNEGLVGIEFPLPVLNWNSGPIKIAAAELDMEQSLAQAQFQTLKQAVYTAHAELQTRRSIVLRYQKEVLPIIADHEQLMELALKGGQLDLVALLSSEESALRAQKEYQEARLSFRRAWLALEAAVGSPLSEVGK